MAKTNETPRQKLIARVAAMAAEARATGKLLLVSEIKFNTAGIPTELEDDYLFIPDAWDIGDTGKLGTAPTKDCERIPGGKLILWQAITTVEFILPPKIA